MKSDQNRQGLYTQWLELVRPVAIKKQIKSMFTNPLLQHDKDMAGATVTHDDASSERKLTTDAPLDAIHVSKNWKITRN